MILVTGGLGFLGAHTVRALVGFGRPCVIVARRTAPLPAQLDGLGDQIVLERADCAVEQAMRAIGERHEITGIVHLAAPAPAPPAARAGFVRTSIDTLLAVLQVARDRHASRVSVASSLGVYQGVADTPYREDAPLPQLPLDPIPAVKKAGELLAAVAADSTGTQVVNLRIATIWGPLNTSRSPVVPRLVHAAVRGEPPEQPLYAEEASDLCYVADCARAIALLQVAESLRFRTYNVGSGQPTAVAEVRDVLQRLVPEAVLELRPGRDPDGPGRDTWLDITRLREDVRYTPEYDLDRGVAEYVTWLRAGHQY
jgi:UDP-glucose 4-epimerase